MKRPVSITVIAILFILAGALALIEVISDLFNGFLNFNFGVLMMPVGFGLLKGKASSRGWAKFWIVLFSLLMGILLGFYPTHGDSFDVTWFGSQLEGPSRHLLAIGMPGVFLLLGFWMWRRLSDPANAPFFSDYDPPPPSPSPVTPEQDV